MKRLEVNDQQEKSSLLAQLAEMLEGPIQALGLIWLLLIVIELVFGLTRWLDLFVYLIWLLFIIDFLLRLYLAPRKSAYLRSNLIALVSLAVPALRLLKIFRFALLLRLFRATRTIRLVKVLGTFSRSLRSVRAGLAHRGVGYVLVLTSVVAILGSAAIFTFEREAGGNSGFADYGDAFWWTAMVLTTMGSEFWPRSPEGRLVCFFLALYAFGVFGYTTATIASFLLVSPKKRQGAKNKARSYRQMRLKSRMRR